MEGLQVIYFLFLATSTLSTEFAGWEPANGINHRSNDLRLFKSPKSNLPCPKEGYFRNPKDCNRFYRCVDDFGSARRLSVYEGYCENGLVFDEKVNACNWPELAAPCSSSPIETLQSQGNAEQRKKSCKNRTTTAVPLSEDVPQVETGGAQVAQESFQQVLISEDPPAQDEERRVPIEKEIFQQVTITEDFPSSIVNEEKVATEGQSNQERFQQVLISEDFPSENEDGKVATADQGNKDTSQQWIIPEDLPVPENADDTTTDHQGNEEVQQIVVEEDIPFPPIRDEGSEGNKEIFQQVVTGENFPKPIKREEERLAATDATKTTESGSVFLTTLSPIDNNESGENEQLICTREGFFRHPTNCRKFYRCVSYDGVLVAHVFACPQKLVFNETQSLCDRSEGIECKEAVDRTVNLKPQKGYTRTKRALYTGAQRVNTRKLRCTKEGFFRHPDGCNVFYRCVASGRSSRIFSTYVFTCPNNLVFDEEKETCNWPDQAAPCEDGSRSSVTRQAISSPTRKSSWKQKGTERNGGYRGQTKKSPQPPKSVANEPRRGGGNAIRTTAKPTEGKESEGVLCSKVGFFTHPDDCNKFYKCVDYGGKGDHFVRYDFECPQSLAYDEDMSMCNWPHLVSACSNKGRKKPAVSEKVFALSDEEIHTTDSVSKESNSGDETTTLQPQETTEDNKKDEKESKESSETSETNIVCSEEGYFRHPKDCNKFYRCVDFRGDGQLYVRYDFVCPEGLVFDEVNSVCNWPTLSPPCDANGDGDSSEKGERTTSESTLVTKSTEDGISESETEPGDTVGPSTDSTSQTTEESLETVATVTDSDGPSTADEHETTESEEGEQTTDPGSGTTRGKDIECTEEGFFRNPNDCSKFYRCVDFRGDGQQFVRYDFDCPEGLVFDEVNSVCNWPTQSPACESGKDGESSGREKTTPSGTEGTQETDEQTESTTRYVTPSSTQSSKEVTDDERSTTESSTVTDSSTSQSTESQTGSEATTNERETTTKRSTEDGQSTSNEGSTTQSEETECTEEGFFRNPNDCSEFYRCVDVGEDGQQFVRYDFKCPEGLVFDEENIMCTWPSEVPGCENGTDKDSSEKESTSTQITEQTDAQSTVSSVTDSSTQKTEENTEPISSTTGRDQDSTTDTVSSTSQSTGDQTDSEVKSTEEETATQSSTDKTTAQSSTKDQGTTSAVSSTTRGKDIECTEEGFFRNPNDCSKFYRCVDFRGDGQQFVRYDFDCPDGLVFDEVNSVCNWPTQSPACKSGEDGDSSGREKTTTSSTTSDATSEPLSTSTSSTTSGETSESTSTTSEKESQSTREEQSTTESTTGSDSTTDRSTDLQTESEQTSSTEEASQSSTTDRGTTDGVDSTTSRTDIECTKEGFFRNPDDCSKFYRCVDFRGDGRQFVRYDFVCPEGLVFDEVNSVCNWPESSPPCDSSTTGDESTTSSTSTKTTEDTTSSASTPVSETDGEALSTEDHSSTTGTTTTDSSSTTDASDCTEEGFFRDPSDCKKYYRCLKDGEHDGKFTKDEYSCSEGEVFDEEKKFCNREELSPPPCGSATNESTTAVTSTESSSTASQSTTTVAEENTSSTGSETTESQPTESSTDRTTESQPTESSTDRTTESQPPDSSTDRTTDSQPTDSATDPTTDESTSTTSSSSTTEENSTKDSSEEAQKIECTEAGFFRHPDDCSKFYRCVDFRGDEKSFVRYDFDCPEGLVFDEVNSVCNWPTMTPACKSKPKGTTSKPGKETDTSSATDSTESPAGNTSSKPSTEATSDNIECKEAGFFRHPNDCTKFYRCVDFAGTGKQFVRYDFICPSGLVFDESTSVCNWPNASPACQSGSTTDSDQSSSTTDSEQSGSTTDSDQSSSTTDSEQSGSTTDSDQSRSTTDSGTSSKDVDSSTTSKADETTDDTSTQSTALTTESTSSNREQSSTQTTSKSSTTTPFECREEGFFRDPEDCSKYYQCIKRDDSDALEKREFDCPDGHIFDEGGKYCNAIELSPPCEDGSTSEGTTSGTTSSSTSEITGSTQPTPEGSTTAESSSTTKSTKESFECTEEGFFRDPEDCSKYYQCVRRDDSEALEKREFDCPKGHIFDEEGKYCNAIELSPPCENETTTESSTGQSTSSTGGSTSTGQESTEATSTSGGSSTTASSDCTEEGFFRHPENCSRYFQCVKSDNSDDFEKREFVCPDGHIFDEEGKYCNAIELSQPCETESTASSRSTDESTTSSRSVDESTTASSTEGRTDFSTGSSTDSTSGSRSTQTTTSAETTSTDSSRTTATENSRQTSTSSSTTSQGEGETECTEEGFFRNPDDCNKFYRCVDFAGTGESFVRYDFDCPEDLVFDEINSVCTWPTLSPPCKTKSSTAENLHLMGKIQRR